jgi:predicted enzyme related to lactoylglutathione lyase
MPERTSYAQGTPNWVDLPTTDQDAAKAFYAGLFGWTYDDQPMDQGQVYSMAVLRGHQVAAISSQPPEMAAAGAPPMWNTYLAVDSADEATAKVERAGGKVAMAPFDVMDAGRMSFVMDPSGAPVALWQANQHIGATLVNEPGTINWNELVTTDPGVTRFYSDVAGLTAETMDMGTGPYTVFKAGEGQKKYLAQKPEEFLADTVGRINLNYDNINRVASDFVDWDPLTLFMNVGNVVLREQFIFGITNIPITPTNYYRPSVQRLLQVSANIYDASRTDLFPTVFLPTVGPIASPFNPSVPFSGISGYTLCPDRNAAIKWAATNDLGLPAIVGAKKGIPNFNEYVLQSAFQITRKLEMVRPTTNSLPNQTNQLMILAVSNVFGVETWNSYSRPISNSSNAGSTGSTCTSL